MRNTLILCRFNEASSTRAGGAGTAGEVAEIIPPGACRPLSAAIRRHVLSGGRVHALAIDTSELDAALKADRAFAALRLEAPSRTAHRIHKKVFLETVRHGGNGGSRFWPARHEGT